MLSCAGLNCSLVEHFPRAAELMLEAREDVLAFCHFPDGHWKKIWSTNLLERVNEEIKRRIRVVGIFPNDAVIPVLEKLPAQRPGTGNRNSVIQIQA